MIDFLLNIESFFETYSFAKEVLLVVFGAVFGGICTVLINNGAIRKQCKFDMQYKILSEEAENVSSVYKKLEHIEIGISFGSGETAQLKDNIDEAQLLLLSMSERLRNKRKFVRKYVSALIVEKSEQYPVDFANIFYQRGEKGFYDLQLLPKIGSDRIAELRDLTADLLHLNDEMVEAMEKIISPSIFSWFKRKVRKPVMFLEKCNAMRKVQKKKNR